MRFKIIIGYTILAVMLVSAIWMTYSNTQSLAEVNNTSEQLVSRRNIVDSLVCSLLEVSNAERSILLGDDSQWQYFSNTLSKVNANIHTLRHITADSSRIRKLDSLMVLLDAKRKNTMLVMDAIGKNMSDAYFDAKVKALENGSDSVVIRSKEKDETHRTETTLEIVKSRRGFFRRLADVFRKQYADTVSTKHFAHNDKPDSTTHNVDISDSVAHALAKIRHEELLNTKRKLAIVEQRRHRLQAVSLQIAKRTSLLLEDIQADEQKSLYLAVNKAIQSRQDTIYKIAIFGLLAFLSAVVLLLLILRDIRRERRDRQQIEEAKAETERIMQQRERLLLTITHDIKAPAASIAGFTDLLADGGADRKKATDYIANIASSARHLLQLVDALLDYHKIDSRNIEIHDVSFSPSSLVKQIVSQLMPIAQSSGLSLNADIADDADKTYKADAFRIRQILTNLITNALKYTDHGGVKVDMRITNSTMTVSVADTGRGMTIEEMQQIFKPFVRLANSKGKSGTGLGLAITQELVQILHGKLTVRSAKGKGSTFVVSLPLEETSDNEEFLQQENSQEPISKKDTDTTIVPSGVEQEIRAVIVDDDKLQLQLLTEMFSRLQGARFVIYSTTDVATAIDTVRTMQPQLLLSDIEMPEMSGGRLLQLIEGEPLIKIAMTAHERSILTNLRSQGFDDCLFKPFTIDSLADTLSRLLHIAVCPRQSKPLASILAFADGDKEAEKRIKADLQKAIEEYIALLSDTADITLIAKAAHKAMPLLEMIYPEQNEWLRPITPEHIDSTTDADRTEIANRLRDVLIECQRLIAC